MGIRAEWIDANHQIHCFYVEVPWTWQEYRVAADQAFSEIKALNYPVATVVDVTTVKSLPKGDILGQLQYIESNMPANVFASVMVGAPYIITAFMNVLMKVRPNAKRIALFAKTMDEATALVQERLEQIGQDIPKS